MAHQYHQARQALLSSLHTEMNQKYKYTLNGESSTRVFHSKKINIDNCEALLFDSDEWLYNYCVSVDLLEGIRRNNKNISYTVSYYTNYDDDDDGFSILNVMVEPFH